MRLHLLRSFMTDWSLNVPKHWKLYLLAGLCICFAFFQAQRWANNFYINRAENEAKSTLGLVVEALDQAIGRFQPIPTLVASDPAFRELLGNEQPDGNIPFLNEKLRQIALSIEASEVYLMGLTGQTIATSNYRDEDSFLGSNFSFRPYFTEAVKGETSMFHALGTTSGERGFFFSAPVLDGVEILGVIAVKMPVGSIEQEWQDLGRDILVADDNGIIFMSSRTDFRFRTLAPLSDTIIDEIDATQQFPLNLVKPLNLSSRVIDDETVQVSLVDENAPLTYFVDSMPLSLAGWHGIVLTPLATVQQQVVRTLMLGGFAAAAVLLTVLVFWQRRVNALQRMHFERQQREMLEVKVQERTADLNIANTHLQQEVVERRLAEERLRKSQKELVQAGKLAALGQMSAAISHEINQPLGAIKSYAANASEFLSRNQIDAAKENVVIIGQMTDRITEISKHLRNFARQPGDKLKEIEVARVIDATLGIIGPQLRSCHATVVFDRPDAPVHALGGELRLQQVLVNVVTNALEAMSQMPEPRIEISVVEQKLDVVIQVRDYGPGLEQENLEHVFDAFYTTKSSGSGMGLGMSISQNIINDFGGALSVSNHPEGGAIFTVTLRRPGQQQPNEALT